MCGAKCSKGATYLPTGDCESFNEDSGDKATCEGGCVACGKGGCKDGAKWRVEITADSQGDSTYECVCPPPPN